MILFLSSDVNPTDLLTFAYFCSGPLQSCTDHRVLHILLYCLPNGHEYDRRALTRRNLTSPSSLTSASVASLRMKISRKRHLSLVLASMEPSASSMVAMYHMDSFRMCGGRPFGVLGARTTMGGGFRTRMMPSGELQRCAGARRCGRSGNTRRTAA